jgi:hypothetical protein
MKYCIINRTSIVATLLCTFLGFAGFANATAIHQSSNAEQSKKGTLSVTVTTEVSGLTLEPGEYEVKQVKSANGPVIRFTRYTYNAYAQEGVSGHQWDVVGNVKVTVQPQDFRALRTQLLTKPNSAKATGLQIRGSSVQYLFPAA